MEAVFEGEVPSGYNIRNAYPKGKVFIYVRPNDGMYINW